jgi:hypothetical protein
MASRPIFIPRDSGKIFVETRFVDFKWHPGMAVIQKQKSIAELHESAKKDIGLNNLLEVSSKSTEAIGVSLSAFNLTIETVKLKKIFSVECAYQASKIFENGGPYVDILDKSSIEAKKDSRIKNSGNITGFTFFGEHWGIEPITAFYDWLYINALIKKPELILELMRFDGFTDIEFNPEKSVNCQAYSVALCISLHQRGLLDDRLKSKYKFLEIIKTSLLSNSRENQVIQNGLNFG